MDQVLFPAFTQCLELLAELCGGVKASFHRSSRDTTMALSLGPFPQRLLVAQRKEDQQPFAFLGVLIHRERRAVPLFGGATACTRNRTLRSVQKALKLVEIRLRMSRLREHQGLPECAHLVRVLLADQVVKLRHQLGVILHAGVVFALGVLVRYCCPDAFFVVLSL